MNRLLSERLVTYAAAARRLPPSDATGETPSNATVWRWTTVGILSRSGSRIRLESIKVGGRNMTTVEAMERFFAALSEEAVHA